MTERVATDAEIAKFVRHYQGSVYTHLAPRRGAIGVVGTLHPELYPDSLRISAEPVKITTLDEIADSMTCWQDGCRERVAAIHNIKAFGITYGSGRCMSHADRGDLWLLDPAVAKKSECTQGCP